MLFLVSPYTSQVITYDDLYSLNLKAGFAKQAGMLGVAVRELSGDIQVSRLIFAPRLELGK